MIDIHQTAILEGNILFEGDNITIGPYSVIQGLHGSSVTIGEGVEIGAGSKIGMHAEHRKLRSDHGVFIDAYSVIRENVVIHSGLYRDTVIGLDCYIMSDCYIAHDNIIEDGVTLSSGCRIAGHSYLMTRCNLGMGSLVHQYGVIGSYSMLGMGSIVIKSSRVEPGMKYAGTPVRFLSRNSHALENYTISAEKLATESERFYALFS